MNSDLPYYCPLSDRVSNQSLFLRLPSSDIKLRWTNVYIFIHPYTRQLVTKQPLLAPPSCRATSSPTCNFRTSKRNSEGREEEGKSYRNLRSRIVTFNLYDNLITDKPTPSNLHTLRRKKKHSFFGDDRFPLIYMYVIQSLQNMFYFVLYRPRFDSMHMRKQWEIDYINAVVILHI